MHFMLSSISVVYVLTTPMPEDGGDNPTVEQVRKRAKWDNDDYVCRGLIFNDMSDSLFDIYQNVVSSKELWDSLEAKYMTEDASSKKFLVSNFTNYKMTDSRPVMEQYNELLDFKHTLKHLKEEITLVELGSHLRIGESLRVQDNDKPKGNNVAGPSVVNTVEHNNSSRYNDNKSRRKHHDNMKADPNKKPEDDDVAWWVDSGATVYVCKDRCWFKTYKSLNDGSILHMGNESTALVHGQGCVNLRLNIVNDNIGSAFMSTSKLNDSILWHARLGHVHFKRMQDMSKDGLIPTFDMDTENDLCDLHATPSLGNKKYFVTFIDDVLRTVVRLPDPKLETLGERGIECIFVGYAEYSKAFRFYVTEPNESVAINLIIESRDAIFNENRFSSVPRPSLRITNGPKDIGGLVIPEDVTEDVVQQPESELRKSKRNRTLKKFRPEFQLYLIEGTRDEVSDQQSYCFNVKDDLKIFDEAIKSQDVAFWKEAINDEMDSIMGNNTWVLADLPPGCKPFGFKWIFKRKLKVDATIEKFKARLVIQGFKQKSWIDYFDTYAPMACISIIRLLIAMTSIHNLIIHQMKVKTAFLNGELEEEQAPKQWHQKFVEVVLSNGYLLNQADNVYITNLMKLSHYIEKVLKKFNYFDCTPISIPMDTGEKLMSNNGQAVSQLEYSRVIGYLMYVMTCTRLDIAYAVGKLSRYTSNPGYTAANWISNTEDNSSTSGWVFLLGGGAISWASKKQTCITGSTMESKFVALAAAGKEAEWLKNLLLEIPLWYKPIAPISIRCDSAATLANAYSQMYNRKPRHLGVRHNMIRELIKNGVVSIEFVRSQQNLADHLTKGLARYLVIKSAEGMGSKSN
ncbi:zinc finger, CCHC-type containing protein [Tanacetum coccineum]